MLFLARVVFSIALFLASPFLPPPHNHHQPGFLYALTEKLRDENQKITVRQQAGLYLKNILYAKDDAVLEQNRARWRDHVGNDIKVQIRANILTVLRR
jgi:hypothetical protein